MQSEREKRKDKIYKYAGFYPMRKNLGAIPSKVTYLQHASVGVKEQIVRLHIAMTDAACVNVSECAKDLIHRHLDSELLEQSFRHVTIAAIRNEVAQI